MTASLGAQFADYAAYHTTRGNRACHSIGIPLIVFAVVALSGRLQLGSISGIPITLAEALIVLATLFYWRLDAALALMMLVVLAIFDVAGRPTPPVISSGLFLVGWIFQFAGHMVYEKKSPAFFRNAAHLLVGPLWILAKATGRG